MTAYVHEDAHGQGLGKALSSKLFEFLAGLGYHQAFAGIALPARARADEAKSCHTQWRLSPNFHVAAQHDSIRIAAPHQI